MAGLTRSCGCLLEESIASSRLEGGLGSMRHRIASYRASANKRSLAWNLSEEECRMIFVTDCHYCGMPPANIEGPTSGSKHGGFTL